MKIQAATLLLVAVTAGCIGLIAEDPQYDSLEPVDSEVDVDGANTTWEYNVPEGDAITAEGVVEEQVDDHEYLEYDHDEGTVTFPMAYAGDEVAEHESQSVYAFKDAICGRTARDEFPDVLERRDVNHSSVGLTHVDDRWAVSVGADMDFEFQGQSRSGEPYDEDVSVSEEPYVNETAQALEHAPRYVETHVKWRDENLEWTCTVPVVVKSGLDDTS